MPDFDPYDSLVPVFLETEIPKRVHQIGTAIFRELWGEPAQVWGQILPFPPWQVWAFRPDMIDTEGSVSNTGAAVLIASKVNFAPS